MKKNLLILLLFLLITFGFFYKTVLSRHVPFPGDLLIAEYNPWKSYSYLGYNPGSYPNKAQYFDTLRQIYPWKTFSINSLKQGNLPLWNPYSFSGAPLLANVQSAVFYPFNILYFALPQIFAWTVLIFLQPLLGSFFTFLYAKKIGLSRIASVFSAVSFAFSSFMSVWLEYGTIGNVILWLPLILLSIENLKDKFNKFWSLILIMSLVFSLFAGHIQIFIYLFIFSFTYAIFRSKKIFLFSFLFLLSIGLGAIQLFPSFELILQAARSSHVYSDIINKILIQPWQLIMLLVPDFFGNPATRNYVLPDTYIGKVTYIGLIPLFFVLLNFFRKKNQFIKFFLWISFFILLFVTLNPITYFLYKVKIPFISDSAPTLSIFILSFSLSILSGFGIDIFRKENWTLKKYFYWSLPLMVVFLLSWFSLLFLPNNFLSISFRNLFYSTIILVLTLIIVFVSVIRPKVKLILLVCLFLLTTFDLWKGFNKFNPFVPKEIVYPPVAVFDFLSQNAGINRVWGYKAAGIEANFTAQYSLFSPDGYDPLYPKRYGEFIQSSEEGKVITRFTDRTRSDAVLRFGQLKVFDLLGVKYILDRDENASTQAIFPADRFSLIYQKDEWKIFENKKALPRAFLISDYKVAKNAQEFEKIFFDKDFDPSEVIILEKDLIDQPFNDSNRRGNLQLISYFPNEIKFGTESTGNRLLFLSDTYYPGWKAYVDGKETEIYRANYAFKAIAVSSGKHIVKFKYDPLSFKFGYVVSLMSIFSLLVWLLAVKKR
ncbi:MAG: YfhO family protein [Candidatus Levybacteria bacterium]|nr:YfhO family protein [Candidatus Levybacteria bacterium]